MKTVVVAIPTFRRAAQLEAVLRGVGDQIAAAEASGQSEVSYSILVVDNDPARSGEEIAQAHGVTYVNEPQPGIAAVRNRSLRECHRDDAVIFIDDDETPEPGWLLELTRPWLEHGPAAVAGRVITDIPQDADPWVRASGAFVRPTRTNGQRIAEAATNNLLVDLACVRALAVEFDERFGLSGGSDSMFTLSLTRRGGEIIWANDAVVIEQEDPERFTRDWVLRRTFRFGNTSARVRIALAPSRMAEVGERAAAMVRGGARVVGGGLHVARGAVTRSLPHRAQGQRTMARGYGMFAGAVGHVHNEYGERRAAMPAQPEERP